MSTYEDLAYLRLDAIASHLQSGDEWELVAIEPEDLGLPQSTRRLQDLQVSFRGGLMETKREQQSTTELLIEYGFDARVDVDAAMAASDAQASGWDYENDGSSLATVRAQLDMTGWVGVLYDEDETNGEIDYIRICRMDGTQGYPLAVSREGSDARILDITQARSKRSPGSGPNE
jgi:hypothetical protein